MLHPDSRPITCFSTHLGLFQYKRLNFGVNSASEVFQHTIQQIIQPVKGARNISDDIIIYGEDDNDHDKQLDAALHFINENGLTLNLDKCVFRQEHVDFNGHRFGANSLSPDPEKVRALHEASEPTNVGEVLSFLGLATYCARFINNYTTLNAPLRELTRRDTPWEWTDRHQKAFQDVKDALSETATTAYFNSNKETTLQVDASPVGLGAVLTQEERPVAYASRALSNVEQWYSQTEREALAIIWACEHFHTYLYGSHFTVITDHQPLVSIWTKSHPPLRIARWGLCLQAYDAEIKYRPGKNNPTDYMSRLT